MKTQLNIHFIQKNYTKICFFWYFCVFRLFDIRLLFQCFLQFYKQWNVCLQCSMFNARRISVYDYYDDVHIKCHSRPTPFSCCAQKNINGNIKFEIQVPSPMTLFFHSFFLRACNKYAQRYSTYVYMLELIHFFFFLSISLSFGPVYLCMVRQRLITNTNVTHKRAHRNFKKFCT